MTKLSIAKAAIQFAVGSSVTKVTHDVIVNNVDIENTQDQIQVLIGAATIGSMVSMHAKSHVDAKVDKIVELWNERKSNSASTD